MKKFFKRLLTGAAIICGLLIFTSCTKSFCTTSDLAVRYAVYDANNRESINSSAEESNMIVPVDDYWDYIDEQVDEVYDEAFVSNNEEAINYIPSDIIESHKSYLTASAEEQENYIDVASIKGIIRFTGADANGYQSMWANINKWNEEFASLLGMALYAPTSTYYSYYQSAVSSGAGNTNTCFTPTSGYFGIDHDIYVQGKSWGQTFSEVGFLECLLVYPIGWLLHTFTTAFGVAGSGQVLAIFLVTLICRLVIILVSMPTYKNQYKMTEIQPQIQMLQARYPNAQTNPYEKQQLAQAQMKLYKDNHIHIFSQFLVLFIQFPLFICVWGALQGSAILTTGSLFGLSLSTVTSTAMGSSGSEAIFAFILFIMMAICQVISVLLPQWIQRHRKKKIVGDKTVKVEENPQASMMKYMPYIMSGVMVIMGLQVPAAMAIYWFFGGIISILQSIIIEIYYTRKKSSKGGKGGKYTSYKKVDKKKHMSIR